MRSRPVVLFVCTHNAARSQIAEALLRARAGDRFEAASAGLEPTVAGGEELRLARFRRVRDEIDARLRAWLRTV